MKMIRMLTEEGLRGWIRERSKVGRRAGKGYTGEFLLTAKLMGDGLEWRSIRLIGYWR